MTFTQQQLSTDMTKLRCKLFEVFINLYEEHSITIVIFISIDSHQLGQTRLLQSLLKLDEGGVGLGAPIYHNMHDMIYTTIIVSVCCHGNETRAFNVSIVKLCPNHNTNDTSRRE